MPINEPERETLSLAEVSRGLAPYIGKPLTDEQMTKISRYLEMLRKWNEAIALTSIEDEAEIVARHFGESLFVASLIPLQGGRLADVGTGAGFPGLPLKISNPALQVTLVEPNLKKCAVLREVQAALGFSGVEIARSRYEDLDVAPNSFDFLCSRALGGYRRLLQWSKGALKPQGRVVIWLGIDD